jgi:putative addiction module CopG family antidote
MAQSALNLSAPLDAFVEEQVASGAYPDRDAVIADAVSLLSERFAAEETDDETKLARLNAKLQKAIDSLDRGEGKEITDVKAWLDGLGRRKRIDDAAA